MFRYKGSFLVKGRATSRKEKQKQTKKKQDSQVFERLSFYQLWLPAVFTIDKQFWELPINGFVGDAVSSMYYFGNSHWENLWPKFIRRQQSV